jgi:hypothetical protein
VNAQLHSAAQHYHGAFTCWKAFYILLGHRVPDEIRNLPARRHAGADLVRCWAVHEKAAVTALVNALALL